MGRGIWAPRSRVQSTCLRLGRLGTSAWIRPGFCEPYVLPLWRFVARDPLLCCSLLLLLLLLLHCIHLAQYASPVPLPPLSSPPLQICHLLQIESWQLQGATIAFGLLEMVNTELYHLQTVAVMEVRGGGAVMLRLPTCPPAHLPT